MSSILHELEIEVLSRLPVKSLVRFRCVCKAWLRLLTTDHEFIKLHLNRSTISNKKTVVAEKLGRGMIKICSGGEYTTALAFPVIGDYFVVGSCNGILCLANKYQYVYLWNPCIGQYYILPISPLHLARVSLVFGFGFHEDANRYKVVAISHSAWDDLSCVSVYTLGSGTWRALDKLPYLISRDKSSSALVNGSLHWIARWSYGPAYFILSFDLKDEVFREIPPPPPPPSIYPCDAMVGELGGLLCSFVCSFTTKEVHLWAMNEYGVANSWEKLFTIGGSMVPATGKYLRHLDIGKNGDILLRTHAKQLLLYDPKSNSTKRIEGFFSKKYQLHNFIGSLVSPRVNSGVGHNS